MLQSAEPQKDEAQKQCPKLTNESGMTIIEILIVIALLGTIMSIVMTNLLSKSDEAKADLTVVQQQKLVESLKLYKVDNQAMPSTEEGLIALVQQPASAKRWRGPYTEAEKLKDAWGQDFRYEWKSGNSVLIWSAGADGEFDNEDDLRFPDAKSEDNKVETIELQVPVNAE